MLFRSLKTFRDQFPDQQYAVTVVSADTEDDLRAFPDLPFTLIADPQHKIFRRFGAFPGTPKHATVALDKRGQLVFRTVGDQPYMDAKVVKRWIEKAASSESSTAPN